ncbi:MAG: NfeD family protein [Dehalococcoidia bacterium]|nr:NfeD family protein [Dehalococcoidia bacterium]
MTGLSGVSGPKEQQVLSLSNCGVSVYSLLMQGEGSGLHFRGDRRHRYSMRARFWFSLLSTIAQLAGLAAIAVWLLPANGVRLPWVLFLVAGIVLSAYDTFTYLMGTRALDREPVRGLESMAGLQGVAASDLAPSGIVRIRGELWRARSEDGEIIRGTQIEVLGRERLVLTVRRTVK